MPSVLAGTKPSCVEMWKFRWRRDKSVLLGHSLGSLLSHSWKLLEECIRSLELAQLRISAVTHTFMRCVCREGIAYHKTRSFCRKRMNTELVCLSCEIGTVFPIMCLFFLQNNGCKKILYLYMEGKLGF